jgi:hypothetical protein
LGDFFPKYRRRTIFDKKNGLVLICAIFSQTYLVTLLATHSSWMGHDFCRARAENFRVWNHHLSFRISNSLEKKPYPGSAGREFGFGSGSGPCLPLHGAQHFHDNQEKHSPTFVCRDRKSKKKICSGNLFKPSTHNEGHQQPQSFS